MTQTQNASDKSRLVAVLLAFFLGGIGAHRFYTEKTGSGVAQLVMSLTLIFAIVTAIWVLIDLIMLLVGNFRDAEGYLVSEWHPGK